MAAGAGSRVIVPKAANIIVRSGQNHFTWWPPCFYCQHLLLVSFLLPSVAADCAFLAYYFVVPAAFWTVVVSHKFSPEVFLAFSLYCLEVSASVPGDFASDL